MSMDKQQLNKEASSVAMLGRENTHFLDKVCAWLLVLSPILQHYMGIYENAGFTALLLVFPIITLRFFWKVSVGTIDKNCLSAVFPLLLFEVYSAFVHGVIVSRLLYSVFMIWVFFCVAAGCVNVEKVMRYASYVACAATVLLVVQYATYYVLGTHLKLLPTQLFLEESSRWLERATVGITEGGSMYRPSSIFMEPSHLFIYMFPLLCLCLLLPDMTVWRKWVAVILTAGIVLSTSGMGIAVAIGLWGLFLAMYYEKQGKIRFRWTTLFSARTLCILILLFAALVGAYLFVPLFRKIINRIFVSETGSTAIEGRVRLAINYIQSISGKEIWVGTSGVIADLDFNRAGFFSTYIRWGLVGVILTYWFYGQGLMRLKGAYFWLSFIILVLSFFTAHTHGTFYMMYFFLFLMDGYSKKKCGELSENSNLQEVSHVQ